MTDLAEVRQRPASVTDVAEAHGRLSVDRNPDTAGGAPGTQLPDADRLQMPGEPDRAPATAGSPGSSQDLSVSVSRRLVHRLLRSLRHGRLELVEGPVVSGFGTAEPQRLGQEPVTVHVLDARVYPAILRGGSVALGQAYADGWWETDDLVAVLSLFHRGLARFHAPRNSWHNITTPVRDPIARRFWRPDRDRDRSNIGSHYDLGNELFTQLLDPSMLYSSAVFDPPELNLSQAQAEKVRRIAEVSGLRAGEEVLEIGTGWGALAIALAEQWQARVTTTTISAEQYAYASERVAAAGLTDRVTVLDRDYRDLAGQYDRIVSVEMIEAVDWREYTTFFAACRSMLRPDGALAMQAIVINDEAFNRAKRTTDFIKDQIFPGGCLPSIEALRQAAHDEGMVLETAADYGPSYARTLAEWRANLHASNLVDRRFQRLWEFYFAYCQTGFEEGYISVAQLRFVHAQP